MSNIAETQPAPKLFNLTAWTFLALSVILMIMGTVFVVVLGSQLDAANEEIVSAEAEISELQDLNKQYKGENLSVRAELRNAESTIAGCQNAVGYYRASAEDLSEALGYSIDAIDQMNAGNDMGAVPLIMESTEKIADATTQLDLAQTAFC